MVGNQDSSAPFVGKEKFDDTSHILVMHLPPALLVSLNMAVCKGYEVAGELSCSFSGGMYAVPDV